MKWNTKRFSVNWGKNVFNDLKEKKGEHETLKLIAQKNVFVLLPCFSFPLNELFSLNITEEANLFQYSKTWYLSISFIFISQNWNYILYSFVRTLQIFMLKITLLLFITFFCKGQLFQLLQFHLIDKSFFNINDVDRRL